MREPLVVCKRTGPHGVIIHSCIVDGRLRAAADSVRWVQLRTALHTPFTDRLRAPPGTSCVPRASQRSGGKRTLPPSDGVSEDGAKGADAALALATASNAAASGSPARGLVGRRLGMARGAFSGFSGVGVRLTQTGRANDGRATSSRLTSGSSPHIARNCVRQFGLDGTALERRGGARTPAPGGQCDRTAVRPLAAGRGVAVLRPPRPARHRPCRSRAHARPHLRAAICRLVLSTHWVRAAIRPAPAAPPPGSMRRGFPQLQAEALE
jgi:hypothetical protein